VRLKLEVIWYITANHLTKVFIYLTQYSALPDTSVVAYHAKTSYAVMETDRCIHIIAINLMCSEHTRFDLRFVHCSSARFVALRYSNSRLW